MERFFKQIAEAMQAAGFPSSYDGYGVTVMGFRFAGYTSFHTDGRVFFLRNSYKPKKDGTYSIKKAVQRLVRELPKLIERKKDKDTLEQRRQTCIQLKQAVDPNAPTDYGGTSFSIPGGMTMLIRHDCVRFSVDVKDTSLIMALIDFVKEHTDEG